MALPYLAKQTVTEDRIPVYEVCPPKSCCFLGVRQTTVLLNVLGVAW